MAGGRSVAFFLLAVFLLISPAHASSVKDAHTEVELVSEVASIQPGRTFWAAVHFKMDPEWHVYWKNPGDSGLAPKIKWRLPEGFKAGEVLWPYPSRIDLPPLTSYGYEEEVLFMVPIEVPASVEIDREVTFAASLDWLACKVECIPGKADLTLTLPVKNAVPLPNVEWSKTFAQTRAKIPLEEADWRVHARRDGGDLILEVEPLMDTPYDLSSLYFYPENDQFIQHAASQRFKKSEYGYTLTFPLSTLYPKDLVTVSGVLISPEGWRGKDSEKAWRISVPLESAAPKMRFWTAVLFAFLGGLILNLMPCVLPVLSLKILGFVKQAQEEPRRLAAHGWFFTLGVLVSFWALAGVLLAIKSTGSYAGWGFQLQSPVFVAALAVLFIALALNFFGVYEFRAPFAQKTQGLASRRGLWGAFLNGALATLVATPCTAPFMGAALGFALLEPPTVSFSIFTSLAFGMALPVLVLSLRPEFLRFVPKPGPWMDKLKKFLGILLLATSFWLLWVLSLQVGFKPAAEQKPGGLIAWEVYSDERLEKLKNEKRIVFIDFTAAWCLTCQVNERIALDIPGTAKAFREMNVAPLKADWTNHDEKISRALGRYGRSSIPFYVFHDFRSGEGAPVVLPEILAPVTLLEAMEKMGYN